MPHVEMRVVLGVACQFVDLETLIRLKRAAGRPKDLERIAELEALRDERLAEANDADRKRSVPGRCGVMSEITPGVICHSGDAISRRFFGVIAAGIACVQIR